MSKAISHAASGKNGAPGVVAVANAYRTFAKGHHGPYAATRRAPDAGDEEMLAVLGGMFDVLADVLAPFHLESDEIVHALRGFRSVVHGFVSVEADNGFGLTQSADESFDFILQLFMSGLAVASHESI